MKRKRKVSSSLMLLQKVAFVHRGADGGGGNSFPCTFLARNTHL